jgi:hypothetical protein
MELTTLKIFGLILCRILAMILLFQLIKFRFYKLTEDQAIFWRLWLYKPSCKIPKSVKYECIRHFVLKNDIKLSVDYGGMAGYRILFEPTVKVKN